MKCICTRACRKIMPNGTRRFFDEGDVIEFPGLKEAPEHFENASTIGQKQAEELKRQEAVAKAQAKAVAESYGFTVADAKDKDAKSAPAK